MSYQIICGFGVFHNLENGKYVCNCEKTFGYSEWNLQKWVRDTYEFYYPSKISKEMRREYYNIHKARNGHVSMPTQV